MGRRKKLVNNTNIPQHTIEAIARCIFPDILAYHESEEGQREFAQWKAELERPKTSKDNSSGKSLLGIKRAQKVIQSLLSSLFILISISSMSLSAWSSDA